MAETRDISMHFWATQEEYDLIQKNMALSGSTNLSAFLRKMAIDGMVIKLDMPEIQEMLHLAQTCKCQHQSDCQTSARYRAHLRYGLGGNTGVPERDCCPSERYSYQIVRFEIRTIYPMGSGATRSAARIFCYPAPHP